MSNFNRLCGRIDRYDLRQGSTGFAVYVAGHPLAVQQLSRLLGGQIQWRPSQDEWTGVVVVTRPSAPRDSDLADLLATVLTLYPPAAIDLALALDWYQVPPDGEHDWRYTPVGQILHDGKYQGWMLTPPDVEDRQRELAVRMSEVVRRHPSYASADVIATVPSHILTNTGYAELIAAQLGALVGIPTVRTRGKSAIRPQRKDSPDFDLSHEFYFDDRLEGKVVLVVDDLYREGETISAVGLAARRADASAVVGLAAARTMRN